MRKASVLALMLCLLAACGNQEESVNGSPPVAEASPSPSLPDTQAGPAITGPDKAPPPMSAPAKKVNIPTVPFSFDPVVRPLGVQAHGKYLSDKVEFRRLPMQGQNAKQTAVVGSRVARFYPGAKVRRTADLKKLGQGIPLAQGAFLVITGEHQDADTKEDWELNGLFAFQDHYNYFYQTEYNGQPGLVFGADLAGLRNTAELNSVLSFQYTRDRKSTAFYDHNGPAAIPASLQEVLARDRVAFETVGKNEYSLGASLPDDMVSLYVKETNVAGRSLFLTTDLFAHTLHLLFDKMLAASEEERFFPAVWSITREFLREIKTLQAADRGDKEGYTRALALAETYFSVPKALCELAPDRKPSEYSESEVTYEPADRMAVLSRYPENIQKEIALIDGAAGFAVSPNFGYREDYTQFKPRGHYSKNGVLSAYFRVMMWYGRIHFYMSLAAAPVMKPESGAQNAKDASLYLTPAAVIITGIAKNNPGLLTAWKKCFDPITALIGVSDDLSLYDLMPALDAYSFGDLAAWADDPKKIVAFLSWGSTRFTEPRIPGNSVFFIPSVGNLTPAAGFRLFGQRFTYDSYIHTHVSAPRLSNRAWVRGLDVMKVFGCQAAEDILARTEYSKVTGLKTALDRLEREFSGYGADFWGRTYYNRTLYLIKSQAQFEQGQGFFFTETPRWNTKALLAGHGTWAELRHDTILYVKQMYAEMGGVPMEPTFRIEPVPMPIHYVEPNLYFFRNAYLLVVDLLTSLQKTDMFTPGYPEKLEEYAGILRNILPIVEAEAADRPVSGEQNKYLATVPSKLARLILPANVYSDAYMENLDQFRMALVADIYTNAELGQVLETAVGLPYRLHVALNDGQGGKRIAVGYTFSYYEFPQPMNNRLTDEQWKKIVYADHPDMKKYLPDWAMDITGGK